MSELRKLTASDGMTLYNGEVLSKEVYLGTLDSPDNWWEITDEEAAAIQAEMESPPAMEEDYLVSLGKLGVQ